MKSQCISLCLLLIIASCTSATIKNKSSDPNVFFEILETFISEQWSPSRVIENLDRPNEIERNQDDSTETWFYYHKATHSQQWAFEFDKNGKNLSVTYLPSSDGFIEFSLENIKKRWKKYNCENKQKQILQPGLIKQITYVSCDNGKRYIEYTKYNEVVSVSIEK